jgi:ketosteroid isomerase-like protein
MEAVMLRLTLVITLLLAAGGAEAHDAAASQADRGAELLASPAREAAKVVDAFHAALAHGNAAAAAALLDDGAVIFEEGEAEQSKAAYVASHLPADISFLATVGETIRARTGAADAGLAWVATQGHMQGRAGGRAVSRETTESIVLRRTAQGWRIVHVHWSSRAAAAPGG